MEEKKKSFWQKPENWMSLLIGGGILAGLGYALTIMLPLLITMASNIVVLGALVALIVGTIAFVAEQHTLIGYMWRSAMRWITGCFVELDPIGIMKTYSEKLQKHQTNLQKQIKNLRIQIRACNEQITKNEDLYNEAMSRAQAAKRANNNVQFQINANEAGLRDRSRKNFVKMRDQGQKILDLLDNIHDKCYTKIEMLNSDIRVAMEERETLYAMTSAIASARSIIQGNPDDRALFEQSLEARADAYARDMGDLDDFIATSKNFVESADLQNGVFQEEALRKLEAMENKPILLPIPEREPIMSKRVSN